MLGSECNLVGCRLNNTHRLYWVPVRNGLCNQCTVHSFSQACQKRLLSITMLQFLGKILFKAMFHSIHFILFIPEPNGQLEQDDSLRELLPADFPDDSYPGGGGQYVLLPVALLLPQPPGHRNSWTCQFHLTHRITFVDFVSIHPTYHALIHCIIIFRIFLFLVHFFHLSCLDSLHYHIQNFLILGTFFQNSFCS